MLTDGSVSAGGSQAEVCRCKAARLLVLPSGKVTNIHNRCDGCSSPPRGTNRGASCYCTDQHLAASHLQAAAQAWLPDAPALRHTLVAPPRYFPDSRNPCAASCVPAAPLPPAQQVHGVPAQTNTKVSVHPPHSFCSCRCHSAVHCRCVTQLSRCSLLSAGLHPG